MQHTNKQNVTLSKMAFSTLKVVIILNVANNPLMPNTVKLMVVTPKLHM
jgi:hypothetical protein